MKSLRSGLAEPWEPNVGIALMSDKEPRNGNDGKNQAAKHHHIRPSECSWISIVDRSDCRADPATFTGENFKFSALHAC